MVSLPAVLSKHNMEQQAIRKTVGTLWSAEPLTLRLFEGGANSDDTAKGPSIVSSSAKLTRHSQLE